MNLSTEMPDKKICPFVLHGKAHNIPVVKVTQILILNTYSKYKQDAVFYTLDWALVLLHSNYGISDFLCLIMFLNW